MQEVLLQQRFIGMKFLKNITWLKMPHGQRVAAVAVLCMILVVTVVKVHVSRHWSVPAEVDERMDELAKFREEIDSAQIDTSVIKKRKTREKTTQVHDREIEDIPVY